MVDRPFAVRSSSLLEDSHYQPFAGIYSTYMVPYTADALYDRVDKRKSSPLAAKTALPYAGKIGIVVETVFMEHGHHSPGWPDGFGRKIRFCL